MIWPKIIDLISQINRVPYADFATIANYAYTATSAESASIAEHAYTATNSSYAGDSVNAVNALNAAPGSNLEATINSLQTQINVRLTTAIKSLQLASTTTLSSPTFNFGLTQVVNLSKTIVNVYDYNITSGPPSGASGISTQFHALSSAYVFASGIAGLAYFPPPLGGSSTLPSGSVYLRVFEFY
jgi:hypothetical protein